jgi:predicted transcriptional regulator
MNKLDLVELSADIVAAYISKNPIPRTQLPELIGSVHAAMKSIAEGREIIAETQAPSQKSEEIVSPAIAIKKSVTEDYIICLEDGLKFKSLKRHLMSKYRLTPDAYRLKWGLPQDYPMVAKNYANARSSLAKKFGLGRNR